MRNTFNHLPLERQKQVIDITRLILETIQPDKIILFGSYARGNYVEHRYIGKDGILYEYTSDYDFLVIAPKLVEKEYVIEEKITEHTTHLKQPVNIIVHDTDFVNESLSEGWYFFSEIVREGILVYDASGADFATAKLLTDEEKMERGKLYFRRWAERYKEYKIDTQNAFERGSLKIALFYLHQATETLFYTMLLVHTGYKPKTHYLYKLRQQIKNLSEELFLFFNLKHSPEDRRLFGLLKRGYIDARYDDEFSISRDDLATLIEKVKEMEKIVTDSCRSLTQVAVKE